MKLFRKTLWLKLTAAFVFIALVGVVLVAILANRAAELGFARYLQSGESSQIQELQNQLGLFFTVQGNWEGANRILRQSGSGPERDGEGYFLRVLNQNGEVVGSRGGQTRSLSEFEISLPIMANGQQIGTLLATPAGQGGRAGEQFLTSVNQALILSGIIAIFIALLIGIFLARELTRPLSRLARATQAIAAGDLSQQVDVTSDDELGQLAQDFNQMARALDISETQRRQLLADTAHDLRTPVSIIRSHLEAMLDGVFPATPENLAVIHEETLHLSRLIDDVRTLSLAETGQLPLDKSPVDLMELVGQLVSSFAPLADADGVQLSSSLAEMAPVTADGARLRQVLANLIANALRYASLGNQDPPTVAVSLENDLDLVKITVADNGPGLTDEQQQRVFDRFWRSDVARNRQKGGSGLGLAISKSIVVAHGGQLTVSSQPGLGTQFTISLPK